MPAVSGSVIVPASAEEAFKFIEDYRNIPRLQPHFTSARLVSEEGTGPGATVALQGHFHGAPMHAQNCIITYIPPKRLVSISDGTVLSRSTWELEPLSADPATTRVTLTVDYKFKGILWRRLGSLFQKEVQGMTARVAEPP